MVLSIEFSILHNNALQIAYYGFNSLGVRLMGIVEEQNIAVLQINVDLVNREYENTDDSFK